MYKIIIVDDEPFVRTGFKMSVDWKKYGFQIVAEASNGREALAEIERCCPDVIFTDIKMPVMDGIELIRHVRKNYPHIISIVLSNYNEFDLVKQAMKAGAEDYFLKVTVDISKLIQFMQKLKPKLEENKIAHQPDQGIMQKTFSFFSREATPVNISNMAAVLDEDQNLPEVRGAAFFLSISAYSDFVDNRCGSDLSKSMKLLSSTICSAVACSQNAIAVYSRDQWILLMNSESIQTKDAQRSAADGIRFAVQQYLGLNCNIGYGVVYQRVDGLKRLLNQSNFYFSQTFFQKDVFPVDFSGKRRGMSVPSCLEGWNKKLGCCQWENIRTEISAMVRQAEKTAASPQEFKEYVIRILMMLELKFTLYSPEQVKIGVRNYMGRIYSACSSDDVCKTAEATVGDFLKQMQKIPNQHRREMIQAVDYIEKHFDEKITLQGVADYVHISKNYLSVIFKTECGMSFQDYLIKFRMEKAAQLLLSSSLRVSEICEKVGYGDIFYFDRSFKRYFGKSPKELRDSLQTL